ncbi:MAG TPA: serine/threonine-protein kinase [Pyrinomonadaceae bacterium]|nr:serine/threonine-protein kinase [Pyrinomonadaceae bacterium]
MLKCPQCGREFPADVTLCTDDGTPLRADSTLAVESPAPAVEDPLVGLVLDEKYRLDERLGEGGMGTVYRATHLLIDRPVAVKVLNSRLVTDEAARERFRREARAAGRLQHTNAVSVTDFGETRDGLVYIVMELLEGRPLRDVLARESPLDAARAVSLMLQIAAAVAAAHEAGVIHRDLKPGNIFVVQRAHAPHIVKVLDFGIAKLADTTDGSPYNTLTGTGVMIGTPRYMSPEQCDGATLLPSSDVYSMGVILYEMLTGQVPFSGASPLALALKHSSELPRPLRELVPNIPPQLEQVVLRALEKKPEDRPADAGAFRRELYETAERLGLEHFSGFSAPTIETLRDAGTETPSGRLVIDIERLRQSRATAQMTGEAAAPATAEEEALRTGGRYATREASAVAEDKEEHRTDSDARPGSVRFRVPIRQGGEAAGSWIRRPVNMAIVAALGLLLVAGTLWLWSSRSSGGTSDVSGAGGAESEADETMGRSLSGADGEMRGAKFSKEPRTAVDFYENGTYYFSIRSYDAAVRDFRRAVELQPDFPSAHNRLGRALTLKGQFTEAAEAFRTAIKQKGGNYATAQYNLGFVLQTQGDAEGAAEAYNAAIKARGGKYADAYYQLGGIYLATPGRTQDAADALRKAVEQNGGRDPEAQLKLGVALGKLKDYAGAEAAFREAINGRGGDFSYAHYNLGLLYQETNRTADAIREFETFLQQAPRDENRRRVENTLKVLRQRARREANQPPPGGNQQRPEGTQTQ